MFNANVSNLAPAGACTPQKMAASRVPLDAALLFHTRLAPRGPRTRIELTVFNCVRALVARSP